MGQVKEQERLEVYPIEIPKNTLRRKMFFKKRVRNDTNEKNVNVVTPKHEMLKIKRNVEVRIQANRKEFRRMSRLNLNKYIL